ncbi:MAG: alpha-hydroxy-acid oxidizing protein [Woeseia sp.]|jgi:4-hydroxymandelate oxidase|nr:alpha-hydroxy-acid oxidizing protein [Woeseia sp.]MBT6211577.1 alpha-hydroxy-acid oxidizing protein [Woeseia sp.]
MAQDVTTQSRRKFLQFLAASPLCGAFAGLNPADAAAELAASPADAIDIFDLELTASGKIPVAHWGYLATGVNDDSTLRANRTAFEKYFVRSLRLQDVLDVDSSVEILGTRWPTPIVMAPVGSQKAFHADGELGSARAAKSRNHLQMLSTVSSTSIEEVTAAREAPLWFQLYTMGGWQGIRARLRRAEAAGSPVVVLTVDNVPGGDRHTLARAVRKDSRDCSVCHEGSGVAARTKPMAGGGTDERFGVTWEFLDRLQQETTMKVFVKGIVTAEDAERCVEQGVDGIIVSNHGGRGDDSGRGTIDSLAEIAPVVRGRTTLMMDSGIRRGNDIFKAIALGADAVLVGRPYIWGLGAFGQAGVERALDILTNELRVAMQSFGTRTIADIGRSNIQIG